MELAPPVTPTSQPIDSKSLDKSWNADIPLHLRYLPPTRGGVYNVSVPWPVVFWACAAEEGTKMNVNPFDRVNLGYDGLFGPRTMFYHLQPERTATGSLVVSAQVPVLDLDRARWVDVGTVSVVLLGFMWIMGKLAMAYWGDGQGVRQAHRKKE